MSRTERVISVVLLALIVLIAGTFLLTGGLFAGVVERTPGLQRLKRFIGLSDEKLFEVHPGRLNPAAPPLEIQIARKLLPELPRPYGAAMWLKVYTIRPGGKIESVREAADPLGNLRVERGIVEEPGASLKEAAGFGAQWVYEGNYLLAGKEPKWLVEVVEVGEPASAAKLCQARMKDGATRPGLGRGGWIAESPPRCGFWAGKYYTEVGLRNDGAANADDLTQLREISRVLASDQLVYGGPFGRETATQPVVAATVPQPGPVPVAAGVAQFATVEGGQILSPTKIDRFNPDNLYEKVDGKDGMYKAFYFVELRFGQYTDTRTQAAFDVYIFDMGEPVNAFGIHMAERGPSVESLPLGRDGYASGTNVYFWKDKYYVNVLGPPEGEKDQLEVSKSIATAIAGTIPSTDQPFWVEQYLPAEGLVPHGLKYEATSGLGYDFVQRMFRAEYKAGGTSYQLFLIKSADEAAAKGIFDKFAEATAKYDKVLSKESDAEGQTMVGDSSGVFTAAFTKGLFFGGVTECGDQALAVKQAGAFRAGLTGDGGTGSAGAGTPPVAPVLAVVPTPPAAPATRPAVTTAPSAATVPAASVTSAPAATATSPG